MGSSVPESFPYTMALTMPLLLLAAALSSANTGVEYDYHEEDQPTQPSESVQIENLVRQAVPSRIYSSSWSNNIPGFGKRSRIPSFLVKKRTPIWQGPALWSFRAKESGSDWSSRVRRQAHPCYANPLSCY